jgi:peptide methionine sulfoxide reductase msrA/msrB
MIERYDMNSLSFLSFFITSILIINCTEKEMKYNQLTSEEERVIIYKGTEAPFSGEYYNHHEQGTYVCKRCKTPLYRSDDKFDSGCGWPSFDDEIPGAIKKISDKDGVRIEIVCANCNAHLGHVFSGEKFTEKNTRHCVNSISLNFIPAVKRTEGKAVFASGCFWGTQYYFSKASGVLKTTVGYTGGNKENPTYEDVCSNSTGHAEAVEVIFDSTITNFETLAKLFFETHDFTQVNRQGPDVGSQYRSAIFYQNENQKEISEKLIKILSDKGYIVATRLNRAAPFWNAENYHQNYYDRRGGTPYCHIYKKIF